MLEGVPVTDDFFRVTVLTSIESGRDALGPGLSVEGFGLELALGLDEILGGVGFGLLPVEMAPLDPLRLTRPFAEPALLMDADVAELEADWPLVTATGVAGFLVSKKLSMIATGAVD